MNFLKGKINWGMLVSHHPPCQYDRTFSIGKRRFCVRCTSIFSGVLFTFLFFDQIVKINSLLFASCFILPLYAIINFTLNELGLIKNNNLKRFISGLLLGFSLGFALNFILNGNLIKGLLIIIWVFMLEFIVAIILNRHGKLENFFKEYEEGIFKN